MKTRHGKILTTTGELLHLPEEDFQKIRTNRRRKDCTPETTTNADNAAPNMIVNFSNQHVGAQIVEEYVLKENIDDINRNWETKGGTIQVVDKCIGSLEICTESELNKTDDTQTEIAVDCRYSERDDNNIKMDYINDVQNDLLQLKNPFYDNLEAANNGENHLTYQHNYEDGKKIYDCSEVIQSYTEINRNNEALKGKKDEIITHQVNMESPIKSDSYHKIIYDNDTQEISTTYMHLKIDNVEATSPNENDQINDEKYSTQVIIAQNDTTNEKSDKYVNDFDIATKECIKNEIYLQSASTNVSILQTYNKVEEKIVPQNQNMILQQDEHISESESVITKTLNVEELNVSSKDIVAVDEETTKQQNKQYLYLRTGTLDDIIAQNKCINIPLHQINLYSDQHNQLKGNVDNCKQIKVLNGDIRAINIKQSDKQNTILLVSNDSLQNRILQINKGNITIKDVNR